MREYFCRVLFGRLVGIIMGMAALGGMIGASAAGWVFDSVGSYQGVWLTFSGTTVIPIVLLLRLKTPGQMSEE